MSTPAAYFASRLAGFAAILFAEVLWAAEPTYQVILKTPQPGVLSAVTADWQMTFAPPEGKPQTLPAKDLVRWGKWTSPGRGAQVLLSGGGLLIGELLDINSERILLDSDHFGDVALPLELATGVILRPANNRPQLEELTRRMRADTRKSDSLLLDNGDQLLGKIVGFKDGKIEIRSPEPVKWDVVKVAALVFNPALAASPMPDGLHAWVGVRDGSRFRVARMSVEGAIGRLTLLGGVELKCEAKSLTALQPIGGNAVYLSDLKPDAYRFIPYLTERWPYEADRNVLGGALLCGGHEAMKGLGLHSAASLTYTLPAEPKAFEAEIGIDDASGGRGSAIFRVFTDDGGGTWKSRFDSPIQRGGNQPVAVSVDLTGMKRISLLVEFADRGDELDYANWLNARFIR